MLLALKNVVLPAFSEPVPTTATLGVAYSSLRPLTWALDFNLPVSLIPDEAPAERSYLATGLNVTVASFLALQCGFQLKGDNPRVSVGSTIDLKKVSFVLNYNLDLSGRLNPLDKFSIEAKLSLGDRGRLVQRDKVDELYLNGLEAYAQGRLAEAIAFWQQALEIDPGFAPARENIATAERAMKLQQEMAQHQQEYQLKVADLERIVYQARQANALSGVTITLLTPWATWDSNNSCGAGPRSMYVQAVVTNISGGTLGNLKAKINFPTTNPGVDYTGAWSLDDGESDTRYIGTLANGASVNLYYFINYPCWSGKGPAVAVIKTFSITLSDGTVPDVTQNLSITTRTELSSNAGGQLYSFDIAPGTVLGQVIKMTTIYDFGNVGSGNDLGIQPAGNTSFNSGCYQLIANDITNVTGITGLTAADDNVLYKTGVSSGGGTNRVTVDYYFKVVCVSTTATTLSPWADMVSGTQQKYTGNYTTPTTCAVPEPFLRVPANARGPLLDQALDAAAEVLGRGLARLPASTRLAYDAGVVAAMRGRAGEAIDAFARVLELDPGHRMAREYLAGMLAAAGRFEESVSLYRAALREAPGDLDLRLLLARALAGAGRPDEARTEAARVLAGSPGHPAAEALRSELAAASPAASPAR